jgi:ubiquinone/menaquinone biosynthesis C-methylase UbiE
MNTDASGSNPMVDRYNARAQDYARWWAPVLEGATRLLVDYVEWYGGGPPPPPATVLEVGTGSGNLTRAMLGRWPAVEIIASDVAAGMLELARTQLADLADPRIRFLDASAQALPLPAESVDLVVSSFVLQLVPDRLAALREARRLLRPGGIVAYVSWINSDDDEFLPSVEFDEAVLDLRIDEQSDEGGKYAGDFASARSAAAQLRRAGFGDVIAREDELEYNWTADSYLDYKLTYDETELIATLTEAQRETLERGARKRLSALDAKEFGWRPPIVYAAGRKSR